MFGASQTAEAAARPSGDAESRAVQQLSWLILAGLACTIFIVGFLIFAAVQAVAIIDHASVERERMLVTRAIAAAPGGMNEITLHAMAESLDLIDARLTTAALRQPGEEMVLVNSGADRVVAWVPHRFGTLTFQTVAPLRIGAGVVFVAIVGLIGWRVHVVGRGLDNSRLAAAARAKTDPLTGLGNRLAFDAALDTLYDQAEAGGPGFVLVTFDLDGFKTIND
ncbi:MAG: diguanylate cyclase, partial [Devosia sp.]